jgi:hypothetical protein
MVAMLNASKVTDDATIASKWSMPPQIGRNRNPPHVITVNYTPLHFPSLPKQNPRQGKESKETQPLDPSNKSTVPRTKNTTSNMDNSSNHSNASVTSGGTSFTKEDGQSLLTSLTELFMEDMKNHTTHQDQ